MTGSISWTTGHGRYTGFRPGDVVYGNGERFDVVDTGGGVLYLEPSIGWEQCDDGNGWSLKWDYLRKIFDDLMITPNNIKLFHMNRRAYDQYIVPDRRNTVSPAHCFWECT